MKQRTLTGVVLALVAMVLLGSFHLPWVPQLTAIVLCSGAVWELLDIHHLTKKGCLIPGFALAIMRCDENHDVR